MEILIPMKPYLDIETKVLIEQCLYGTHREGKETFSSYITRKQNKYRDLLSALGHYLVKCSKCGHDNERQRELPDEIWSYIIEKHGHLNDEHRKNIQNWDSSKLSSSRLMELMLRLDNTNTLVAAALADKSTPQKATYLTHDPPPADMQPTSAAMLGGDEHQSNPPTQSLVGYGACEGTTINIKH